MVEQNPELVRSATEAMFGAVMSVDEVDERSRNRGHLAGCATQTQTRAEYAEAPAGCTCRKTETSFGSVAEGPPGDRRRPRVDPAVELAAWLRVQYDDATNWSDGTALAVRAGLTVPVPEVPSAFTVVQPGGTVLVVHVGTIAIGS